MMRIDDVDQQEASGALAPEAGDRRMPYLAPKLVAHGTIFELTRFDGDADSDGLADGESSF